MCLQETPSIPRPSLFKVTLAAKVYKHKYHAYQTNPVDSFRLLLLLNMGDLQYYAKEEDEP